MKIEEFEKYFDRNFGDWFDQHGNVTYIGTKDKCVEEIYDLWIKSNRRAKYFWFTQLGKIVHEDVLSSGPDIISIGSIRLGNDILQAYRNHTIEKILQ